MTDDKPNELTLPVATVRALTRPHNVQVELLWLDAEQDHSLFRDFTSPDRAIEAAWYVEGLTDGHAAALDAVHRALAVTPLRPSEREVYLAELQAMYRAFRPQNIANPREAAQHIGNLRAFDAQQEEQIATLKARVAELEVERDVQQGYRECMTDAAELLAAEVRRLRAMVLRVRAQHIWVCEFGADEDRAYRLLHHYADGIESGRLP